MREGWSYKKLGEVCKTTSGGTPSKAHSEYYEGGTIPWLRSGEVKQGAIFETEMFITEEGLNNSSAKIVPEDSVAVAMYGATVGQVGIIKAPMCTNQAICCILPSKELLPDYLYRFLSSKKEEYLKNAIGGAQPNISQAEIKKTLVSIPPLTTQQQIVSELDLLSHILDQKRQQLKEYDALAESIFYDMFGDLSLFKTREQLIDLYKFIDYRGKTPTKISSGIPLVTAKNVRKGYLDYSIKEYISEEEFNQRKSRGVSQKGDILFTTEAPMGFAAIADLDVFSGGQRIITLQNKNEEKINNLYALFYILSDSFQDELLNQATGATVKGIKGSKLEKFLIPLPPLSLQRSFASKIRSIEHQKQLLRASIKETEMLFQSRMDYWFNS